MQFLDLDEVELAGAVCRSWREASGSPLIWQVPRPSLALQVEGMSTDSLDEEVEMWLSICREDEWADYPVTLAQLAASHLYHHIPRLEIVATGDEHAIEEPEQADFFQVWLAQLGQALPSLSVLFLSSHCFLFQLSGKAATRAASALFASSTWQQLRWLSIDIEPAAFDSPSSSLLSRRFKALLKSLQTRTAPLELTLRLLERHPPLDGWFPFKKLLAVPALARLSITAFFPVGVKGRLPEKLVPTLCQLSSLRVVQLQPLHPGELVQLCQSERLSQQLEELDVGLPEPIDLTLYIPQLFRFGQLPRLECLSFQVGESAPETFTRQQLQQLLTLLPISPELIEEEEGSSEDTPSP
jgi:hypothetical protein